MRTLRTTRPFGPGLMGDERHAEDLLRQLGRFVGRLGELDAAAFAAAAGVDLRLHDDAAAELVRDEARFVRRVDDFTARRRDAVVAKDLFRLIFVHFHGGARFITE